MNTQTGKKLTSRSKILVKWTTNPANMGYDGRPDDWDDIRGEIMSLRQAYEFSGKLGEKIGQGTYRVIKYFWKGDEISKGEILALV